jgi:hypothetical protein
VEIILLLATLAASVVVGVLSLGLPQLAADPGGPGLFPLVVATVTGTASAALVAHRLFVAAGTVQPQDHVAAIRRFIADTRKNARQLGVVLLVLAFPVGIEWIGFTVAVLLFSFLVVLVSGKGLGVAALSSVLITAAVYVAYAIVLGAVLPQGRLIYEMLY